MSSQSFSTFEIQTKRFNPVVPQSGAQPPANASSVVSWQGFSPMDIGDWDYRADNSDVMTLINPLVFLELTAPNTLQVLFQFRLRTAEQNGHYWQTVSPTRPLAWANVITGTSVQPAPFLLSGEINCSPYEQDYAMTAQLNASLLSAVAIEIQIGNHPAYYWMDLG